MLAVAQVHHASTSGNLFRITGHDAPHLRQTLELHAVRNLPGTVGAALVDRWYDLSHSRGLDLSQTDLKAAAGGGF